jgi:hypothetical protein
MAKSTTLATGRARLWALGGYVRRRCCFAPLQEQGKMAQTGGKYRPIANRLEGWLGVRCGAKTIAHSHVTMSVASAVHRALGRRGGPRSRRWPAPCRPVRPSLWPNSSASLQTLSNALAFRRVSPAPKRCCGSMRTSPPAHGAEGGGR